MAVLHDVTAQRKNEEMRKEFVANVSHELRTPLTNVRSYAETLRTVEDIPRETESGFPDIIISETDRMTRIVQDLITPGPELDESPALARLRELTGDNVLVLRAREAA